MILSVIVVAIAIYGMRRYYKIEAGVLMFVALTIVTYVVQCLYLLLKNYDHYVGY